MSKLPKPVRRTGARPIRILGWLLGIRRPLGHRPVEEHSIEVWQWAKSKYRLRALVLLLTNAVLFAGLGCFALWLRTGHYVLASSEEYWQEWFKAFDPTSEQQATLIDYLLYPIPVDQVPLMLVIVGLVLASLTAVPILVSMLYRFPFALIFTVIIAFVALLPWLAITVTFCCFLARWRPLRFSFHYATALVALLPLLAYYTLATRGAPVTQVMPLIEIAKLYVPWISAVVAACILMGIVLTIAKVVNYRPGAIAPLLAVMFTIPVVLFEVGVGRDELYYRLLESRFGPGSKTHFVDFVDASAAIRRLTEWRLEQIDDPRARPESVREQVALEWQFHLLSGAYALHQHEAVAACDAFRKRFPDSRYIPNTLYIEGRAIDMRIDQELFRKRTMLRYYNDFPNAASKFCWQELHDRFPGSPLAMVATLRLALLEARANHVDRATVLLDELIAWQKEQKTNQTPNTSVNGWQGYFAKLPASGTLGVDTAALAQEGHKLRYLLVNNRDPHQNDLALVRLLNFDPRHAMYRKNLMSLQADIQKRYPLTLLGDNVEVLIAATEPSRSLRIAALNQCVHDMLKKPGSDALPQARYELGVAFQEDNRPTEARQLFEQLVREHHDLPWGLEAERKLASMGISAPPENR